MKMRFFLWSYANNANFAISKSKGLLGFPEGADSSWCKAITLTPGDIVLIRNSNSKDHLEFYGHCVVTNIPYRETEKLVWVDEISMKRVIYPYRVTVDFNAMTLLQKGLDKKGQKLI